MSGAGKLWYQFGFIFRNINLVKHFKFGLFLCPSVSAAKNMQTLFFSTH